MFGIIRVSKTDYFRNGSGSSDPNRPKVLKITVPYHMELGGDFQDGPQVPPIRTQAAFPEDYHCWRRRWRRR